MTGALQNTAQIQLYMVGSDGVLVPVETAVVLSTSHNPTQDAQAKSFPPVLHSTWFLLHQPHPCKHFCHYRIVQADNVQYTYCAYQVQACLICHERSTQQILNPTLVLTVNYFEKSQDVIHIWTETSLKRRKRFEICLLGNEIKIKYLYQQCLVHFTIILLDPWRHVFSVLTNYCCWKFSNNFLKLKNKNIIIKSVWLQWINIYVESASYTCIKCLDELNHWESWTPHSNS